MSSSKFVGLEGVDFDSPDVYETRSPSPSGKARQLGRSTRRPASNSSDDDSEDNGEGGSENDDRRRTSKKVGGSLEVTKQLNSDIIGTSIDPTEASKRFQLAAGVDGRHVDFSSSIQLRKKKAQYYPPATFETTTYALGSGSGYRTSAGGEGPGDDEAWSAISTSKEKPIDKFRRLRYEMEELEKELQSDTNAPQVEEEVESTAKEEGIPSGVMLQLSAMKLHLAALEERTGKTQSSTSAEGVRRLIERLSRKGIEANGETTSTDAQEVIQNDTSALTADGARLTEIDRRLAGLEDLVGIKEAMIDETNSLPRPLLPSLARIEHLLTLLTHPRHLDGISRRIKVLVSELERLHEARRKLASTGGLHQIEDRKGTLGVMDASNTNASSQAVMIPVDTMQKLDSILPMMSKMEPLIPIVPALLARLHSLNALHASSNTFVDNLNTLEIGVKQSQSNTEELKGMLTNLEASFADNQARVESNLKVIEERMENITKRSQALQ